MILLLSIFCAVGLLLIALAVPLIRRRVPPNALYGLRVKETLEDEAVWYEANARAGRDQLGVGIALILASLALALVPWDDPDLYGLVVSGILIVLVIAYCVRSWRVARAVKADLRSRPAASPAKENHG